MKAPKFSKLALDSLIIFACLAIPAFAQRGGGFHGGGGSFGGRGGFRSGASAPPRMGGGYSGRMSSAPAPRVDPMHGLAAAAIVCTPVRPTETSELRILSLRLVALQTASGLRLVVPPYLVGPRFLRRRLEARRIRDGAGRCPAEIGPPPRARRGLREASQDKEATFGRIGRWRGTSFLGLRLYLTFADHLPTPSPEAPGFGRTRLFPQLPGSRPGLRMAIGFFQVCRSRITF
jgi:hypothetical protein